MFVAKFKSILLSTALLAASGQVIASSCEESTKQGFHEIAGTPCLNNTNFASTLLSSAMYEVTSFTIISDELMLSTVNHGQSEYEGEPPPALIIGSLSDGSSTILLEDIGDVDPKKVDIGFRGIKYNPYDKYVYYRSSTWPTSDAIRRFHLPSMTEEGVKSEFFAPGNNFNVVNTGKYAGYITAYQHKLKKGGGSYDVWNLLNKDGSFLKEIKKEY